MADVRAQLQQCWLMSQFTICFERLYLFYGNWMNLIALILAQFFGVRWPTVANRISRTMPQRKQTPHGAIGQQFAAASDDTAGHNVHGVFWFDTLVLCPDLASDRPAVNATRLASERGLTTVTNIFWRLPLSTSAAAGTPCDGASRSRRKNVLSWSTAEDRKNILVSSYP